VSGVAVGPELTLDRRRRGSDSIPLSLVQRSRWIRAADDALARPRSERWHEAELSACCAAAASSNAFNCSRTHRSSEVAGSRQPRSSMAAAAKFWDARRKSGSASAPTFAPPLTLRLSGSGARAGGVCARPCG
jgi:hypothetical protein